MSKRGPLDAYFTKLTGPNKKAKTDEVEAQESGKVGSPARRRRKVLQDKSGTAHTGQNDIRTKQAADSDQKAQAQAQLQPTPASIGGKGPPAVPQARKATAEAQLKQQAAQVPTATAATAVAGAATAGNAFGALMTAAQNKKASSCSKMSAQEMRQQADRNQASATAAVQAAAQVQQQLQLRSLLVEPSWLHVLGSEFDKPYMKQLQGFLEQEWGSQTIYPPQDSIFRAFNAVPFDQVRVVILGQDPYINQGEAMGLSFSVPPGIRVPPSLGNIYKEVAQDVGAKVPKHGCLQKWCSQGVLLLNAALTVRAKNSNSHAGKGWEAFTSAALTALAKKRSGIVFLLWGKYAQDRCVKLDMRRHHVLKSVHPSPLSAHRGFLGCRHFSAANKLLEQSGQPPIDWQIDDM